MSLIRDEFLFTNSPPPPPSPLSTHTFSVLFTKISIRLIPLCFFSGEQEIIEQENNID